MKKIKILVVEDVEIAQKIAVHILSRLDCEVTLAATGNAALEKSKYNQYDLIFMDLGLPDVEGITVTDTIRYMTNPNQNTPIVALTAHSADEALLDECYKVGMNDFLTKPLTLTSAKEILDKFIKQHKDQSINFNTSTSF